MFYTVFSTPLGWMGLLGSEAGLRRLILPHSSAEEVQLILGQHETLQKDSFFSDLPQRLNRYLDGEPVSFDDKLDLEGATSFHRQVWQATRTIPYGQTRSYKWLASQVGNPLAPRAVGQAMAANPVPIIVPCHRVITSSGGLGGFSAGLALKRHLLDMEGRHIL